MQKLCVCFVVCALLAALLAGCTPAAQPPVGETGATTTVSSDAATTLTTTETTTATTVATQNTTVPTTEKTTAQTVPSLGFYDPLVTAKTQSGSVPFTVVAGNYPENAHGYTVSAELPPVGSNGKQSHEGVLLHSLQEWETVDPTLKLSSMPQYTADYFEDSVLILLVYDDYCIGNQLYFTDAQVEASTLCFTVKAENGGITAPMLSEWIILIEMDKEDIACVDTIHINTVY